MPRGRVKRESVNPLLIAGTHCMSTRSRDWDMAVWICDANSLSKGDELGTAM